MNRRSDDPILVLDSGLGGLTVVRAVLNRLPGERVVYFGDTARLPYGSKTRETITHYVSQIIEWGQALRPKQVVIACNTASALALTECRRLFPHLTITGVVDPGARAACAAAGTHPQPTVGVIATEATVRSEAYQTAVFKRRRSVRMLLRPTPLLVPLIEEGRPADDPVVDLALRQYLAPMIERKVNVLVLGCTHYPLLKRKVQQIMGPGVAVIDSAERCAEDVARRLELSRLGAPRAVEDDRERLTAYVTDDAARFEKLAPRFLGFTVDRPTLVAPETLYQRPDVAALRLPA